MKLEFATLTHPGQLRTNNEDCIGLDATVPMVVLADGMGGYNAGEIAARMAVNAILAHISASSPAQTSLSPSKPDETLSAKQVHALLSQAFDIANLGIYEAANHNPAWEGMGTTAVCAWWRDDQVWIAHTGDSRCYRWRGQRLERLTKDHSVVQEEIDLGILTEEQAHVAAHKSVLTQALGVESRTHVDIKALTYESQDLYLLCSDGLSDMLSDTQIAQVVSETPELNLSTLAHRLVDLANLSGGRDNISVVLAQFALRN